MNEDTNTAPDLPEKSFSKMVKEISELQDIPEEVIEKLIAAQGSLKDSKFADRINESRSNT